MTMSRPTRRLAIPLALLTLLACTISCTSPAPPGKATPKAISPDLEPFLRSYFATWSAGEMRAYKEHFHKDAVITLVEDGEVKSSLPRDRFVLLQAAARARAKVKPVERMTSFTAEEDGQAATVVAQWELTRGDETKRGEVGTTALSPLRGVDRFTLVRDRRGKWKIVALVFYSTN